MRAPEIRDLTPDDVDRVIAIDAAWQPTGEAQWSRSMVERFLAAGGGIGLVATDRDGVVGYLLGELRGHDFGTDPSGWVIGLGVDPARVRNRVASALLRAATARFRAVGARRVRTMVRRTDVPFLSLFRAAGWVGGAYVQLELDLHPDEGAARAGSRSRREEVSP